MAYSFNGTTQYVSGVIQQLPGYPYTVSAWVRTTNTGFRTAVALGNAADNNHYTNIQISNANVGSFNFRAGDAGTTNQPAGSSLINSGSWTHIAGVAVAANLGRVFVNGLEQGSSTVNVVAFPSSITTLAIGALVRQSIGSYWDGGIADAAIWTAQLSNAEVNSLFCGFKAQRVRPQSLSFCAPSIRNLQDVSRGITLTNNNGATVSNHPRRYG